MMDHEERAAWAVESTKKKRGWTNIFDREAKATKVRTELDDRENEEIRRKRPVRKPTFSLLEAIRPTMIKDGKKIDLSFGDVMKRAWAAGAWFGDQTSHKIKKMVQVTDESRKLHIIDAINTASEAGTARNSQDYELSVEPEMEVPDVREEFPTEQMQAAEHDDEISQAMREAAEESAHHETAPVAEAPAKAAPVALALPAPDPERSKGADIEEKSESGRTGDAAEAPNPEQSINSAVCREKAMLAADKGKQVATEKAEKVAATSPEVTKKAAKKGDDQR